MISPATTQMQQAQASQAMQQQMAAANKQRGYQMESLAYKIQLVQFPTADKFLDLLDKSKAHFTGQTIDIMTAYVHACASSEPVLTNFPTMKEIELYRIEQDIAVRKLKLSVPKIDSHNPLFHLFLSLLKFVTIPRYLRGYKGFDRDKMNEERIYNEISTRLNSPEAKSGSSYIEKMRGK